MKWGDRVHPATEHCGKTVGWVGMLAGGVTEAAIGFAFTSFCPVLSSASHIE